MAILTHANVRQLANAGEVYSDYPDPNNHRRRILATGVLIEYSFGVRARVSPGFNWDEASVPWILQWAFPKSGKHAYPALPHDVAYYAKFCTRKQADVEFLLYALNMGTRPLVAYLRYFALRCFGGIWWRRKPSKFAARNRRLISIYNNQQAS